MRIYTEISEKIAEVLVNTVEQNTELFTKVYSETVTREHTDNLLDFITKSDYFKAPASTRFHSAEEGGLVKHSLLVMYCLLAKLDNPVWKPLLVNHSDDTLVLVSLCHDLCKTYFYNQTWKNTKVYCEDGDKRDAGGKFKWETLPGYECKDIYPFGHGEKSAYFIMKSGIDLSCEEYAAIRWHMGFSLPKEDYLALGNAMDKYPLVLALHEADQEATHLLEVSQS